jgi:hypothetical protein
MTTRTAAGSVSLASYTNVARLPLALVAIACSSAWGCAIPVEGSTAAATTFQDTANPAMVVPPVEATPARFGMKARARRIVAAQAPELSAAQPMVYGATLWSSTHGAATSHDYADAIAVQSTGNVIVGGGFQGTVNLGCGALTATGTNDIFVASLTSAGACVWSKRFGGNADMELVSVSVDSTDNIYLSGYYTGSTNFGGGSLVSAGSNDGYIAKLSSTGVYTWANSFGGAGDDGSYGAAIVSDSVYGPMVVVGGSFSATARFGGTAALTSAGDYDGFVVAYLASTGAYTWAHRFGGTGYDSANAIAARGNAVVVAGTATGSINTGNGTLTTAYAGSDALLGAFSTDGTALWSSQYGGTGTDDLWAVAIDINSNIHIAGTFQTSGNFGGQSPLTGASSYVMVAGQYTSAGAYSWAQSLDSLAGGTMSPFAITVDSIGTTYVAGAFKGTLANGAGGTAVSTGAYDGFLVALTPSTTAPSLKWLRSYAGPGTEGASGLALSSSGSVLASGFFDTSIDFGAGAVAAVGASDMFLVSASSD